MINLDENHIDPFIQDEDDLKLEELIPRILLTRKSFSNFTEKSLQEELENSPQVQDEEDDEAVQKEETNESIDLINKQKFELTKSINSALNETSLSLDFISLLISSIKPNVGKSTMSSHLQKLVKPTSLNSDKLSKEQEGTTQQQTQKSTQIGQGWKIESLNKITTLFKNSSISLSEQINDEYNYWKLINSVRNNNEAIFKIKDSTSLKAHSHLAEIGIKYGYGDSGSSYYDDGLGILRKNEETGRIEFKPVNKQLKVIDKVYKFIRIKILDLIDGEYCITGQSTFNLNVKKDHQQDSLIDDIEKARFFLFEEDLFYQLTRESKILINYNVSIISNKIIIEINQEIIEIEYLNYDEFNEEDLENYYQNVNKYSSINNEKCQLILNYLKLMLCCYYKYSLKLKQKIPTNFIKWKQNNSHPLILRPLLGNIRHEIYCNRMKSIIEQLSEEYNLSSSLVNNDFHKFANLKSLAAIKNPFQKSIEKPLSKFVINLKTHKDEILNMVIEITTNELFVNLIINLKILKFSSLSDLNDNNDGLNVLQIKFYDFNDIEECLDWTIQKYK